MKRLQKNQEKRLQKIFFQKFPRNRVQTVDKGKIILYNMFTKDMNKVNTT